MADDESFLDEDVTGGQDVEVSQKTGFIPALAFKILKWAAIAIAAIIFIVTVVVITTRILGRGTSSGSVPVVSEQYTTKPPVLSWYDTFDDIRTRTSDETAFTVIAKVALGYKKDDKDISNELTERKSRLQDIIRSYFTQKTAIEVMPKNEALIKEELKERVNAVMTKGRIEQVIFLEYNVIPL